MRSTRGMRRELRRRKVQYQSRHDVRNNTASLAKQNRFRDRIGVPHGDGYAQLPDAGSGTRHRPRRDREDVNAHIFLQMGSPLPVRHGDTLR